MKRFKKLRSRMFEEEITQKELAETAGISGSTMTARLAGTQPFTAWEMRDIGRALHIPPEEFYAFFELGEKGA